MTGVRYGVFLRPDAATCWTITQITFALQRQFGLVSAGAFPPHATLAGNIAARVTERELVDALDAVFSRSAPFTVFDAGLVRTVGWAYDIDRAASGSGRNEPLVALAAEVRAAVLPLSVPVDDFLVPRLGDSAFSGHLGLASHELILDAGLGDQVGDFIATLPIPDPPARFEARWCSLLRFSADWSGHWWEALRWEHVRSWDLARAAS